jgi:hypothetical protein
LSAFANKSQAIFSQAFRQTVIIAIFPPDVHTENPIARTIFKGQSGRVKE